MRVRPADPAHAPAVQQCRHLLDFASICLAAGTSAGFLCKAQSSQWIRCIVRCWQLAGGVSTNFLWYVPKHQRRHWNMLLIMTRRVHENRIHVCANAGKAEHEVAGGCAPKSCHWRALSLSVSLAEANCLRNEEQTANAVMNGSGACLRPKTAGALANGGQIPSCNMPRHSPQFQIA